MTPGYLNLQRLMDFCGHPFQHEGIPSTENSKTLVPSTELRLIRKVLIPGANICKHFKH